MLRAQTAQGSVVREKQNDSEASQAPILKKEDGLIDWSRPASQIYNRLRGFTPWPGAYTHFRGEQLSVLRAQPAQGGVAGQGILHVENRRVLAGAGEGTALELLEVQLAGKRRMPAGAFANGYQVEGEVLR